MSKGRGFQIFAILMMLLFIGFGIDRPEAQPEEGGGQEQNQEQKSVYQDKLDMITPQAYAEAGGIELAPGSYISIIGKTSSTEYFKEVKKGVAAAGKELNAALGYTGDEQVKVSFHAPASYENVDDQVNLLDEELALYPVALGIAIVDQKACDVQFDLARENNIPIIAFDSGKDYEGIEAMVTTDNAKAAKTSAKKLAEAMGEEGDVLILAHDSTSESGTVRVKAFKKELKNHKDIKIAAEYTLASLKQEVADAENEKEFELDDAEEYEIDIEEETAEEASEEETTGEEATEEEATGEEATEEATEVNAEQDGEAETEETEAKEAEEAESLKDGKKVTADDIEEQEMMIYLFEKYPDVKGIYTTNAETLTYVTRAMMNLNISDKIITGYDVNEIILKGLENGTIKGTVLQNPFGMGYAAVIAAARASLNMGNEAEVDTGFTWVDMENVNTPEVKALLY